MEIFDIFTAWLTVFTIGFCVLPVKMCQEWHERQSSDGYSGFNFVCIIVSVALWLRYAMLTGDRAQQIVNATSLSLFFAYATVFFIYQSRKRTFAGQLLGAGVVIGSLVLYVERVGEGPEKTAEMGLVAGSVQTLTFAGILYEIFRVFRLGTTEYIPFNMTAGSILLQGQYWIYALVLDDLYMRRANEVGLAINAFVMVLYALYPPKTWRVPVLGTGGSEAKTKSA